VSSTPSLPHGTTQKEPWAEFTIERSFLKPYRAHVGPVTTIATYTVRKDNTISYKGNFYSLPLGAYKGKGTLVAVRVEGSSLVITDPVGEEQICRHKIPIGRGNKVSNTDHKRDKSAAIGEMIAEVAALFEHPDKAREWLEMIKADKPRYIRDQLIMIRQTALQTASAYPNKAMEYCLSHKICSGADFKSILSSTGQNPKKETKIVRLNPLSGEIPDKANIQPNKSSIGDFEHILKKP